MLSMGIDTKRKELIYEKSIMCPVIRCYATLHECYRLCRRYKRSTVANINHLGCLMMHLRLIQTPRFLLFTFTSMRMAKLLFMIQKRKSFLIQQHTVMQEQQPFIGLTVHKFIGALLLIPKDLWLLQEMLPRIVEDFTCLEILSLTEVLLATSWE